MVEYVSSIIEKLRVNAFHTLRYAEEKALSIKCRNICILNFKHHSAGLSQDRLHRRHTEETALLGPAGFRWSR
jgi:hypothetical protein